MARITVYREYGIPLWGRIRVLVDGDVVGRIRSEGSVDVEVPAGRHAVRIALWPQTSATAQVDLDEDDAVVLRARVDLRATSWAGLTRAGEALDLDVVRGPGSPSARGERVDGGAAAGHGPRWVSVRCVFRSLHRGRPHYEERITLWRVRTLEQAVERAEAEARSYAADLSTPPAPVTEYVGLAQAHLLHDDVGDGAEVFSLVRASDLGPADYLDTFFDTGDERQSAI